MSVGWGQDCDENMFWTDCGLPFECNPTCSNPNPPPDCFTLCEIGCFCNEGYIFSDDSFNECVLIENCPEQSLCDEGYVELWGECYSIEETTDLDLEYSGIIGEIPPEIGNLVNLTNLDLSYNQLNGGIPSEIGNLVNLKWLNLEWSQLSGEIPSEIWDLLNLELLVLEYNQFSGEIPPEIGNLTNLNGLLLGENHFNGIIPPEIGNLVNLINLGLEDNQFSGEIPENICNIYQNLWWFRISGNQLCPPYPDCLTEEDIGYQNTSECSLCDEGYTEINGECYYQSDLDVLQDIIDNSQGGDNTPPSDLSPIELCGQVWIDGRLVNLYCSGDDLEQDESYIDFELDIPESIGNLTSLMSFGLEYNNLSSLPESIGNLTNLVGLLLHHNELTSLPESIGNLTNLTGLDVDNNQLTSLPESIGNLTNLTRLLLPVNQLTSLPDNIGNLTNLTDLYLFSNNLTSIPESIGNLSSLELLWLQNNQLTNLPESICNLVENDCSIFLQENEICPPYPECIEDYVGYQDTSECGEPDPQIGDECVTQDGWIGFYDCELCCWDEWIIENWLGDGWCDYLGGCGFEGPLFNCPELGYDCGDCTEDWDGTDPSGLCSDDCLFPGDVNSDSILNILDIVSMITLILDGEYTECGDVNSDGDLNILDVITFVNINLSIP